MVIREIEVEVGLTTQIGSYWLKTGTKIRVQLEEGEIQEDVYSDLWALAKEQVRLQVEEGMAKNARRNPNT